jgi:hypothetical protein
MDIGTVETSMGTQVMPDESGPIGTGAAAHCKRRRSTAHIPAQPCGKHDWVSRLGTQRNH